MLKKVLQSHFFQGSVIISLSTFVVSFLNYLFNLFVVKHTSVSNYGEYSSVLSYIILLTIPFGAFGTMLIRKLGGIEPGQRKAFAADVEGWLFQKFFRYAVFVVPVVAASYFVLTSLSNLQAVSVAFILVMFFLALLQTLYNSSLQAFKAFGLFGLFSISFSLLKLAGIYVSGFFTTDLMTIYGILLFTVVTQLLWGHHIIRRKPGTKRTSVQFQNITHYLRQRETLITVLTTLGIVGIANMDIILVKKLLSAEQAGFYGALSLLAKIIFFLSAPISSVGYIFFTGREHKHTAPKLLFLITFLITGGGLAAILGYEIFSSLIISIIFDERFLVLKDLLWIGGVYGTLYSLTYLFGQYFLAQSSAWSLLSLIGLAAQAIGIFLFSSSLENVLFVNIAVSGGLLLCYILAFLLDFYYNQPQDELKKSK